MSTGAIQTLLRALIDDASLFPPGSLPMARALVEHREHRSGPYVWLLGRFLCPASRLTELQRMLPADAPAGGLPLGIILDTDPASLAGVLGKIAKDVRLDPAAVEIPISPPDHQAAAAHRILHELAALPDELRHGRDGAELPIFIELPREHGWRDALGLIAARGAGAKLRTGGLIADAFPTEFEVAEFIRACVTEGAPFKCTAGLHNAVRHRDLKTGFEHHGFLNLVLATVVAVTDGRIDELVDVLGEQDPNELVAATGRVDQATAELARRQFSGYGSCSFDEPIDDLIGLGLIDKESW
ncbi:MAG TPA: hypothetical protein VKG85_00500 [Actinomycetes bacterium]|nr:hypothetical protein [Actinomycetes bacterium]